MADSNERSILSIGVLLCDCELIPRVELAKITAAAAHQELTMGQYLTRNKMADTQIVRSAVVCQLMLRRKWLTYEIAVDALKIVMKEKCAVEAALYNLKWNRAYFENLFQISELILKSGLVGTADISLAQDVCLKDESPLLSVLVRRNTISDRVADEILSVHEKLLLKEVTFEQAVDLLRKGAQPSELKEGMPEFQPLRLGEILMAADLVTSVDLIAAIEKGRTEKKRFGAILVRDYGMNEDVLHRALFIQTQINSEYISVFDGIQGLLAPPVKSSGIFQ
jgi:hypothetical protein